MKILEAMRHHVDGRLAQAETMYKGVLQDDPYNADALYFLGLMERDRGALDRALELLRAAVAIRPANDRYLVVLANVLQDAGQYDESRARFHQALDRDPRCVEAWTGLAALLQRAGAAQEALRCYEELLSFDPNNADARNDYGVALVALGRYAEAASHFETALVCRPGFAEAHNNLGVANKKLERWDIAADCYRRALRCKPNYPQAWLNLGLAMNKKRDYATALECFRASLAIMPDQVEAHQGMAAALLELDQLEEAQAHRDMAYRRQSVFVDAAPSPKRSVLLLWAAAKGNIPVDTLLPSTTTTRITWMMEYYTRERELGLPRYDLVLNAIGDPDVSDPTDGPVLEFLSRCERPVLNAPAAVARTRRDRTPSLLGEIPNVFVPPTARVPTRLLKSDALSKPGIRLPILIRPVGSHGGSDLLLIESAAELAQAPLRSADLYYASNYVDYRSDDGCYRKYRVVFVDRRPYPYHLAIGEHWMVHYETAGMLNQPRKQEEEFTFLSDPERAIGIIAMAAVAAIGRAMDLDYCGVDFSVLPDGRVLVFEANATMLVHLESEHVELQYKNPFVRRILEAFEQMLRMAGESRTPT